MNWTIILQCFDVSTSRGILEHEWLTFLNRAMIRPCLCKTSATQWWKTYFSRKTRTLSYIFDFYAWNSDLQGHYFKIHLDSVRKVLNVSWVESWNSNTVQSHVWDLIFDLNVYAIRFHLKHVCLTEIKLCCKRKYAMRTRKQIITVESNRWSVRSWFERNTSILHWKGRHFGGIVRFLKWFQSCSPTVKVPRAFTTAIMLRVDNESIQYVLEL